LPPAADRLARPLRATRHPAIRIARRASNPSAPSTRRANRRACAVSARHATFISAWKESLMNLQLTGHRLDITPAIRDYVIAKLERVNRHFDHVIDVSVVLSVDKLRQKVEATIHVRGKDLHAESVDADMYAAIDALADKLDRQVLKYKEQLKDHRTDTAAIDRSAVGSGAEESS
jgi:putative sigma-54 modulation protein